MRPEERRTPSIYILRIHWHDTEPQICKKLSDHELLEES